MLVIGLVVVRAGNMWQLVPFPFRQQKERFCANRFQRDRGTAVHGLVFTSSATSSTGTDTGIDMTFINGTTKFLAECRHHLV